MCIGRDGELDAELPRGMCIFIAQVEALGLRVYLEGDATLGGRLEEALHVHGVGTA